MPIANNPLRSAHAADAHGAHGDIASFDEVNPHHEPHAEHVIVSAFTNRVVLAILLFFTFATVGAANFESWIQDTFHILLPTWLNVFIALSIATVKAILVVLYFMQLRFDNLINSVVFCFSLFAFSLFLGFTAIDLGNRGKLYEFKEHEIVAGGAGESNKTVAGDLQEGRKTSSESITAFRARQRMEELAAKFVAAGDPADVAKQKAQVEYSRELAEAVHHRHSSHGDHSEDQSTAGTSRPRSGTTPGLFDAKDPAAEPATHGGH